MRISDWSSDVCSSDLSLPRTFLGRRRPRRREVTLKQPVGDLEHLGEIFPHIPVLQRGEKAGAAKAVNQPRPNGDGYNAIALLERHQSAKSEVEGHASLRLERCDAGVDGPKPRFVRSHPEGIFDKRALLELPGNPNKRAPPRIVVKAGAR